MIVEQSERETPGIDVFNYAGGNRFGVMADAVDKCIGNSVACIKMLYWLAHNVW